ncbi:MAG: hypothetical protein J6B04_02215 [Clostridia bacterium]|nr:hypothetical protein [Clostridia bacterium]
MFSVDLSSVEKRIGYVFKNKKLLLRALTLSSASEDNNERLEFFGDAVIQMVVSEKLYQEGGSEGDMTERRQGIVSGEALQTVSEKLGLTDFLIRGKGDVKNYKATSSVYEAVAAAIYLDGGFSAAKKFILQTADFSKRKALKNYKGELQEALQAKGMELPKYSHKNIGTPQAPYFCAEVSVLNKSFSAEAGNIKEAEQSAAKKALKFFLNKN